VSELGDGHRAVMLAAACGERSEADHEEVETREGDQVYRHLSQIRVKLTRELIPVY
jgi:hypothetical protein